MTKRLVVVLTASGDSTGTSKAEFDVGEMSVHGAGRKVYNERSRERSYTELGWARLSPDHVPCHFLYALSIKELFSEVLEALACLKKVLLWSNIL